MNKSGRCTSCWSIPCLNLTGCASSRHFTQAEEDRWWEDHFRRMREDAARKQASEPAPQGDTNETE